MEASESTTQPTRKSALDDLPPETIWALLILAVPLLLFLRQRNT